jgi:hypothetical protein
VFAAKWMELEIIMLNERGQSHKDNYHSVSHMCSPGGKEGYEKKRMTLGCGRGQGEEGIRKCSTGSECDPGTLYACMEISQ